MGMVVLRSTTPCVTLSSCSNSNLLTVISMVAVPAADAKASAGIFLLPLDLYIELITHLKTKAHNSHHCRAHTTPHYGPTFANSPWKPGTAAIPPTARSLY